MTNGPAPDGFSLISWCYSSQSAALCVAALEGAGFTVLLPFYQMHSVQPHLATAFGGIPILVPEKDAAPAVRFLTSIEAGDVDPDNPELRPSTRDRPRGSRPGGFTRNVLIILLCILGGVAPALNASFTRRTFEGRYTRLISA